MNSMKTTFVVLLAAAFFNVALSAAAQDVHVLVSTAQVAGKTVYRYRVVNNSTQRITAVHIGYDYPHGVYTLNVAPFGWNRAIGVPASSLTSAPGWTGSLLTTEESDTQNSLEWRSEIAANDFLSGQTRGGFSVVASAPAAAYETGIWTAIFGDTSPTSAALALSRGLEVDPNPDPTESDTTPPVISITPSPSRIWPPNQVMVRITVTVQVSDDRDPNPQVRLVSLTCNEGTSGDIAEAAIGTDDREFLLRATRTGQQKQGRVCTMQYSATDASGNVAFASAAVTVPHDQR